MNRLSFLKKLGIGVAAIVVVPKGIESLSEKKFTVRYLDAPRLYPLTPINPKVIQFYLKYWYPYNVPKAWSVCYSKNTAKKYRVIGIRKDRIFLSQFTDKWASLPFDMELKDFCNNFLYLIEVPII